MGERENCSHETRTCLNQYELIRKYRCDSCRSVMMCACNEAFGHRFLAHQLAEGSELDTRKRVRVTHGFQPGICSECRGLPADPAPMASVPGRTSKIRRYYWRERYFAETLAKDSWDTANPDADAQERTSAFAAIERKVDDDIKALHDSAPKYAFKEPSQAEIVERYRVKVEDLQADYAPNATKGAQIVLGDRVVSPEAFALDHFAKIGWQGVELESVPFHALFGVMMWLVIQDSRDPLVQIVGFGSRTVFEEERGREMIWTHLPDDFGSSGYGERRRRAINKHFKSLLPAREELLWLFDYWRYHSEAMRQYLWAHRPIQVDLARRIVEILPPRTVLAILRYLVDDYWGRYLGWPDLLLYRDEEFRFVEVKSSSDKLSNDQKRWIADNHDMLKLPFAIAKIHRKTFNPRRPASIRRPA